MADETQTTDRRGVIRVIAIETGFDGVALREPGAVFDMPADVFDKRPRLNEHGEPIKDQFYEPPHWFEPVDKSKKDEVEAQRKQIRKGPRVPAIDPARQQAEATADGRLRAAAEAAVRAEIAAADEVEVTRRIEKKLQEMRSAAGVKAPAKEAPKPAPSTPSPDNLPRDTAERQ